MGETLFIDARKLGRLIDRIHRELTDEEIGRIAGTYHAWRGDKGAGNTRTYRGSASRRAWKKSATRPSADARSVCRRGGSGG